MSVLTMAKHYQIRPSQIINLTNDYEAFCFDEACSYILNELSKEDAREPKFDVETPINNDDLIDYFKANNR
jgi:hypothetical protein